MASIGNNRNPRIRSNLTWLLLPGLIASLGFLFALRQYLMMLQKGEPIPWKRALLDQLSYWVLWGIVSVGIVRLDDRFPIQRRPWVRGLGFHLPVSFLVAAIQPTLYFAATGPPSNYPLFTRQALEAILVSGLIPGMIFYWLILVISLALTYQQQYQKEMLAAAQLNAQLSDARLHALKMQLQPHFLFNTLHSVSALVLKKDNYGAVRMINRLGALLRLTLENDETHEVPLSQELALLEVYLEIERIRFQDRLTVAMFIAPETLDACVPNLILQPLVENAVRHGFASDSLTSRIEIHADREAGTLQLIVRDDGPGLPAEPTKFSREGVGLRNTRSRLSELYGQAYDLRICNDVPRGVVATIRIPFSTKFTKASAPENEGANQNFHH